MNRTDDTSDKAYTQREMYGTERDVWLELYLSRVLFWWNNTGGGHQSVMWGV